MSCLFLIHFITTCMMTGVLLFVQQIHYPLMAKVGEEQLVAYSREHQDRAKRLLVPLMLIEMLSGVWVIWRPTADMSLSLIRIEIALLAAAWLITWFKVLPVHKELAFSPQDDSVTRLVAFNRVRVFIGLLRVLLLATLAIYTDPT